MVTDSNKLLGQALGTCTLQRLLGRGGMGAVYLAQQSRPRRTVAIKVLMPSFAFELESRVEFLARFRREADAIAALDHVNIMPIYEYGEQEDTAYLVMPYVTGGTLRQVLEKRGILALNEVVPIIEQAAAALDCAHAQGIVHRDLKPGNILFHADGRMLLADFGLAKMLKDVQEHDSNRQIALTGTGTIVGTPEYLSPEQSIGKGIDHRTDIYSLGIVIFQMLAGRVPFTGTSPVAIAIKHTLEEPPSLSQFNPTIAPSVEAVIMKAIAKKPEQRYASAGELAQALRTVICELDPTHSILSQQETANGRLTPVTLMNNDTAPDVATTPNIIDDIHAGLTEAATPVVPTHTPVSIQSLPTAMLQAGPTQTPSPQPVHPVQSAPAQLIQASPHSPYPQQHHKGQSMRMVILGILLTLVLIAGGFAAYLRTTGDVHNSHSPHTPQKALATNTPTTHKSLTPLPPTLVRVGSLLYGTNSPGARCDTQGGKWFSTSNASLTCHSSANSTELTNTGGNDFAAIALDKLPNGQPLPDDYVVQVQADLNAHSHGRIRILYRSQPDQPLSASYYFTIDPNGSWQFGDYDSGDKPIFSNSIIGKLTNIITIDVVVQGDAFAVYVNGGDAQGHGTSSRYPSGTVGLAADTSMTFKNLAIYSLS